MTATNDSDLEWERDPDLIGWRREDKPRDQTPISDDLLLNSWSHVSDDILKKVVENSILTGPIRQRVARLRGIWFKIPRTQ